MNAEIGLNQLDGLRRKKGKTLAELAADTGLKLGAVWRVLHGKSHDIRKVARVCRALRVSLDHLEGGASESAGLNKAKGRDESARSDDAESQAA